MTRINKQGALFTEKTRKLRKPFSFGQPWPWVLLGKQQNNINNFEKGLLKGFDNKMTYC